MWQETKSASRIAEKRSLQGTKPSGSAFSLDMRMIGDHAHGKRAAHKPQLARDVAVTQQRDGLVGNFGERLLLFCAPGVAGRGDLHVRLQMLRRGEHEHERKLCHAFGVAVARVGDDRAVFLGGLKIDAVVPRGGQRQNAKSGQRLEKLLRERAAAAGDGFATEFLRHVALFLPAGRVADKKIVSRVF